MSAATPRSIGSRAAGLALLFAWLALLGTLGAAVGYVLFLPERDPGRVPVVALQVPPAMPEDGSNAAPGVTEAPQAAATSVDDKAPAAPPAPTAEAPAVEAPAVEAPTAEAPAVEAPVQDAAPPPAPSPEPAQAEPAAEPAATAGQDPPAEAPDAAETPLSEPQAGPGETQEAALPRAPEILPPWRRNAQPFDVPAKLPRIAIVLTGLGMSSAATEAAIKQLPGPISLSFTPYSRRLNEWIALARVNGHEVLLDLPMEPTSYPDDDPGPQALLTALSERQNLARLDWALRRGTGFVGVTAVMGSRFLTSEEHMTPILNELKSRGLLFLDSRASETSVAGSLAQKIGVPSAVNDRFLDRSQASRVAIDARLVQLERIARKEGYAVAIGQPYPVTIERLRAWAAEVETRGFVLAPLSSVAAERLARQTASRESAKP